MKFTEEFVLEGKSFLYVDFSRINGKDDMVKSIEAVKSIIAKYPPNSLYTITNVANFRFDSDLKEILADLTAHNKPYIKYAAIIGIDGVKKVMLNSILKITGRTNMFFVFSKKQAIELLIQKE